MSAGRRRTGGGDHSQVMAEVISEPSALQPPRRDEISTVYVEWNPPPRSPGPLKGHRGALSSIPNGRNPLDRHVTPRKTGVTHVYSVPILATSVGWDSCAAV